MGEMEGEEGVDEREGEKIQIESQTEYKNRPETTPHRRCHHLMRNQKHDVLK